MRRRASATSGRTSVRNARCSTSAAAGGIVGLLRLGQLGAVDAQRLRQRDLDGVGGLDQVLERVLEVVALVDHVGERRASARRRPRAARTTIRNSWNGVIEPTVRSSSPYFESLKWNPPSRPDHREARHDLLDVGVRQVMAEVDEALGPVAGALREQQRRAPVVVHRRVERRLVGLVLGVQLPVVGQVGVDLAQPFEHPLELAAEAGLPGVVHAVGQPHGQRPWTRAPRRDRSRSLVVLDGRPSRAPGSTLARLPNL